MAQDAGVGTEPPLSPLYCPGCRQRLYDYEPGVPGGWVSIKCHGERCHRRWLIQITLIGRLLIQEAEPSSAPP